MSAALDTTKATVASTGAGKVLGTPENGRKSPQPRREERELFARVGTSARRG